MNIQIYNLAKHIRYETDEQKLHILLLNNKKYILDNAYELLTFLGPNLIGRIFCVLDLKSIKLICMNFVINMQLMSSYGNSKAYLCS